MATYAVKIGEIHIRSDRPVSEEDRQRVLKLMAKRSNSPILYATDGVEVVLSVPGR